MDPHAPAHPDVGINQRIDPLPPGFPAFHQRILRASGGAAEHAFLAKASRNSRTITLSRCRD
jgi:hypothetical protein